ncbi:hypothetical protein [Rhodohalobacter sp.]|uniref:hypothetical protein n=1 Tax=Rhodohalobacter sp. TaxID=1974210 RepID=UPI002ACD7628|nr:hypothetical protein [Rhodohalobacter sp.]MDZ7756376.1 hypothetical protein [Rhodohalobacter sp.]
MADDAGSNDPRLERMTANGDGVPDGLDRPGEGAGRFIADAGYLKLREVSLYYILPSSFLDSYTGGTVKNVRLGASGSNVLLFSDYPSYDPEVSEFGSSAIGTGVEVAAYPSARKIYVPSQTSTFNPQIIKIMKRLIYIAVISVTLVFFCGEL